MPLEASVRCPLTAYLSLESTETQRRNILVHGNQEMSTQEPIRMARPSFSPQPLVPPSTPN